MIKRIVLSAISAISIAAPASALPVNVSGDTWLFTPQNSGSKGTFYAELIRQDSDGDFLVDISNANRNVIGYAWVDCKRDQISYDGGEWSYVDHRNVEGWIADIACGRRVK